MTVQKSDPLNANGVPLPAAEVEVLKNGLPSTLPDIDVRPNFTTVRPDGAYHIICTLPASPHASRLLARRHPKHCPNLTPSCLGRCETPASLIYLSVHGTRFGQVMTDHMLYMDFSPDSGWSPPEIKPYGPLNLDPACSCFHYCPNVFEGLKVVPLLAHEPGKNSDVPTGISRTGWYPAFVPAAAEHGTDGALS